MQYLHVHIVDSSLMFLRIYLLNFVCEWSRFSFCRVKYQSNWNKDKKSFYTQTEFIANVSCIYISGYIEV